MTIPPQLFGLAMVVGLIACNSDSLSSPDSSASTPSVARARSSSRVRAAPTPPLSRSPSPPPSPPAAARAAPTAPEPPPPLDPAGVLDPEERRLLEADDATLDRQQRIARAHAQRKLVMADPEHPLRPVLEKLGEDVASGAYTKMSQDMWSGRTAFPDRGDDEVPEAGAPLP